MFEMAPIFRPLSGLAPSKLKIVSKNVIVKYINEDFKLKLVTTKGWYGVIKKFSGTMPKSEICYTKIG